MILFRLIKILLFSVIFVPSFNVHASGGSGGALSDSQTSGRASRVRAQRLGQQILSRRTAQKAQLAAPARTKTAIPQEEYDEATSYAAELTQTDLEPIKQFDSSRPEFRAPNLTKRSVVGGLATGAVLGGGTAAAIAKSENSPSWLKWALAGIGAGALVGALAGYARALYHPKVVSHERARKTANDFNEHGCAANDNLEGAEAWHEHYRMHGNHRKNDTNEPYNPHLHNTLLTTDADNNQVIVTPLHVAAGNGSDMVIEFVCEDLEKDARESDDESDTDTEAEGSAPSPLKIAQSANRWLGKLIGSNEIDHKSINNNAFDKTALHWALLGNHASSAALLMHYGANHLMPDALGKAAQDILVQKQFSQSFRNCKQLQEEIVKRKDLYAALFPAARPVGQSYANADLGILRPPPTVSSISREQRAHGIHFDAQAIAGDYSSRTSSPQLSASASPASSAPVSPQSSPTLVRLNSDFTGVNNE